MNRNREVRELQFSSSQLIVLFLAILILGIFIFLLGVSVGKKQTRLTQEANLARKPASESLKRGAPALPTQETQPSAIDREIASHLRQSGSAATATPPSGAPSGKSTAPGLPISKPTATESKPGPTTPPLSKSAQTSSAEKPKAGTGLAAPAKKTTAKTAPTGRSTSTLAATQPSKAPTPIKGFYYIQLAAFDEKPAAESYAVDIKAAGFPTMVLNPFATDKKPWYRVRVGGYATKEEAEKVILRLKSAVKTKKFEYWITRG